MLEESLAPLLPKRVDRIIEKEKVWPKMCTQLRSTKRTELEERFPTHVCDEWLGHNDETTRRHDKQATPEHWEAAPKYGSVVRAYQAAAGAITDFPEGEKPLETLCFLGFVTHPKAPVGECRFLAVSRGELHFSHHVLRFAMANHHFGDGIAGNGSISPTAIQRPLPANSLCPLSHTSALAWGLPPDRDFGHATLTENNLDSRSAAHRMAPRIALSCWYELTLTE